MFDAERRPRNRTIWAGGTVPARDRIVVLLLAAAILALFVPRVAPFTTDSESYLDVAKNLLAGDGLVMRIVDFWRPAIPDPMGLWPPLFPLAIALGGLAGATPEFAARAIPAASFLVLALSLHALAARSGCGRTGALAVTFLALSTTGVARAAATAWSEIPYLALLVAGTALGFRSAGSPWVAALAGLLVGLAAITRYIGILALPAAALAVLAARPPRSRWALWIAAAALPPALLLARNVLVFGSPGGPPGAAPFLAPLEILRATLSGLRWGLLPAPIAASAPVAWAALAAAAAALLVALRLAPAARIAALLALIHVGGVALLRGSYMGDRFLTPGYPFLWLAAGAALAAYAGRRARIAAAAAALVFVAAASLDLAAAWRDAAAGRAVARARDAELAELRSLIPPGEDPILTDEGHRVRHATSRAAVEVPGPRFRVREFTAADERRWIAAGVRHAVFRTPSADPAGAALALDEALGSHLASRLGQWEVVGASTHFTLYRLAGGPGREISGNGRSGVR